MSTHFEQSGNPVLACGVDRRTEGRVTFTSHPFAVTCEECKATPLFKGTRQRIPTIPVPVYRHG